MKDYKKKYEETLEKAKTLHKLACETSHKNTRMTIEELFPELKKNEDEKIRKELIQYLKDYPNLPNGKYCRTDFFNWLEKQGEQKQNPCEDCDHAMLNCGNFPCEEKKGYNSEQEPADTIKPKFKVGDWVVYERNGNTYQIHSIDDSDSNYIIYVCKPLLDNNDDIPCFCEEMIHLWTIQDAKDGDVLAVNHIIFIYKRALASHIVSYCKLVNDIFEHYEDGRTCRERNSNIRPATKEQRDLLFQKMKEAGYEWNAECKVLGKIEQKPQTELPKGEDYGIDSLYHAVRILEKTLGEVEGYQSDDGILGHKCAIEAVKRLYEHKSAWGEEDEETLNSILHDLAQNVIPDNEDMQWLKSIKNRMQPQKD